MRTVENLIPFAIKAVSESKMEDEKKKGVVNKAYKGYISSLGAGIIQSGLLPTLAMYKGAEKSENKKADTGKLLNAIYYVIEKNHGMGYCVDYPYCLGCDFMGQQSKEGEYPKECPYFFYSHFSA